ncbi:MAG: hypothetical protein GX442_22045 [Candidatus Riflebacteria bacterium]|nr:hypothetical protein [Candidatus Riflebacteria bacterium]
MNRRWWMLIVIVGVLAVIPSPAAAKDVGFDFYYQKVDEVVQINNPEPQGWWEKTKAFGKSVWNGAKRLWEETVVRPYFPGEGAKTWYSKDDHDIAYRVTRVKVRSEAHLLELMGAKGDESKLSDGQKALLASYRAASSKAIKDRMALNQFRSTIVVHLTDTTGIDTSDPKYQSMREDFWPRSTGRTIQMASFLYDYSGSEADATSTMLHEFCHSLDNTFKEFRNPYGKDGSHFVNEKTGKRAAFVEGWAEFNEMLESKSEANYVRNSIGWIRIESTSEEGKYKTLEAKDLTGLQLTEVEGINANIMYEMATKLPDGRGKVFAAFQKSNYPWRNLRHLVRALVKANPGDAAAVAGILDQATLGKLSDKELLDFLGDSDVTREAVAALRTVNASAPAPAAETADRVPLIDLTRPVIVGGGSNPFRE